MEGNKRVSIIDVAKKAGVSIATVSRVINRNGGYSKETEERVRKTIEELAALLPTSMPLVSGPTAATA